MTIVEVDGGMFIFSCTCRKSASILYKVCIVNMYLEGWCI